MSHNKISSFDDIEIKYAIPNLKKLNISNNLITTLDVFLTEELTLHPFLHDLDFRNNPMTLIDNRPLILSEMLIKGYKDPVNRMRSD